MGTPHKHAGLIKAWADGAEIEFRDETGGWHTCRDPSWSVGTTYRIKKNIVKTVGYRRYYLRDDAGMYCSFCYEVDSYTPRHIEAHRYFFRWKDFEWQYDEVEV